MQQKCDSVLFFHWKNKIEQIKDCNEDDSSTDDDNIKIYT